MLREREHAERAYDGAVERVECLQLDPCGEIAVRADEEQPVAWTCVRESLAAVDHAVPELWDEIEYVRVGGRHMMEPCCARVRPATVRDALAAYLLSGDRPDSALDWVVTPAD